MHSDVESESHVHNAVVHHAIMPSSHPRSHDHDILVVDPTDVHIHGTMHVGYQYVGM